MAEQHLDAKQVRKAVKALLAHRQQKNTLDLDAAAFTLQVGLKKAPVDPSPKPRLIPLPHRVRKTEKAYKTTFKASRPNTHY